LGALYVLGVLRGCETGFEYEREFTCDPDDLDGCEYERVLPSDEEEDFPLADADVWNPEFLELNPRAFAVADVKVAAAIIYMNNFVFMISPFPF